MQPNMGTADRIIRPLIALGIAALYFAGVISGTVAVVLAVVAIAFLLTSLIGWCPSYVPFGISTRGGSKTPPPAE